MCDNITFKAMDNLFNKIEEKDKKISILEEQIIDLKKQLNSSKQFDNSQYYKCMKFLCIITSDDEQHAVNYIKSIEFDKTQCNISILIELINDGCNMNLVDKLLLNPEISNDKKLILQTMKEKVENYLQHKYEFQYQSKLI